MFNNWSFGGSHGWPGPAFDSSGYWNSYDDDEGMETLEMLFRCGYINLAQYMEMMPYYSRGSMGMMPYCSHGYMDMMPYRSRCRRGRRHFGGRGVLGGGIDPRVLMMIGGGGMLGGGLGAMGGLPSPFLPRRLGIGLPGWPG